MALPSRVPEPEPDIALEPDPAPAAPTSRRPWRVAAWYLSALALAYLIDRLWHWITAPYPGLH